MTLFRRSPPLRVAAPEQYAERWPDMPPRPQRRDWDEEPDTMPKLFYSSGPLNAEFDPCGAGPGAKASSKTGAGA